MSENKNHGIYIKYSFLLPSEHQKNHEMNENEKQALNHAAPAVTAARIGKFLQILVVSCKILQNPEESCLIMMQLPK